MEPSHLETDPTGPVGTPFECRPFRLELNNLANPFRRRGVGSPNRRPSLWASFGARRAAALRILPLLNSPLGDLEGLRAPPCAVKRTPTHGGDFYTYILAGPQRTGGRSSSISSCLKGAIDASDQAGASLPSWAVIVRFWACGYEALKPASPWPRRPGKDNDL